MFSLAYVGFFFNMPNFKIESEKYQYSRILFLLSILLIPKEDRMKIKFPGNPSNAPQLANMAVKGIKQAWDIDLDYSVASLQQVDEVVEDLRAEGQAIESVSNSLVALGCYVGEVILREMNGKWEDTRQAIGIPLGIKIGSNTLNPIGKVFKRFADGKKHDLPSFYNYVIALTSGQAVT
jgi:hypothetical protein